MLFLTFLFISLAVIDGSLVYIWGLDRGSTINSDNAYIKNRCGLDYVDSYPYFYVGGGGSLYRDTNTMAYSQIIFTYRGYGYDNAQFGGLSGSESCILEYSIDNGNNWVNIWTKYNDDLLDPSFYHVQQNESISNGHGRSSLRIRIENTGNSRYTDKCWFDYVGLIGATTDSPTQSATLYPSQQPTLSPTLTPTTTYPSVSPTSSPTLNPSSNPTQHPNISPTNVPTSYPTANPSHTPTTYPTNNPSTTTYPTRLDVTYPPTNLPTLNPTDMPTLNPTPHVVISMNPTKHTIIPTQTPNVAPTNTSEITSNDGSSKTAKNTTKGKLLSVILIASSLVLVLLVLIFIYLLIKKRVQMRELQSAFHSTQVSRRDGKDIIVPNSSKKGTIKKNRTPNKMKKSTPKLLDNDNITQGMTTDGITPGNDMNTLQSMIKHDLINLSNDTDIDNINIYENHGETPGNDHNSVINDDDPDIYLVDMIEDQNIKNEIKHNQVNRELKKQDKQFLKSLHTFVSSDTEILSQIKDEMNK